MRQVTVVSHEKVRKIAAQLGLSIKEKSGEYKLFSGDIKRSIAVPSTKGGATRIYLVGFKIEGEGFVAHPKPPAKTVEVMLDHTLAEKLVLRALYRAAKALAPAAAKAPASSPEAPAASPEPQPEPAAQVA